MSRLWHFCNKLLQNWDVNVIDWLKFTQWGLKMKLKKFDDYLKSRLDSDEVAAIQRQADIEFESLFSEKKSSKPEDVQK